MSQPNKENEMTAKKTLVPTVEPVDTFKWDEKDDEILEKVAIAAFGKAYEPGPVARVIRYQGVNLAIQWGKVAYRTTSIGVRMTAYMSSGRHGTETRGVRVDEHGMLDLKRLRVKHAELVSLLVARNAYEDKMRDAKKATDEANGRATAAFNDLCAGLTIPTSELEIIAWETADGEQYASFKIHALTLERAEKLLRGFYGTDSTPKLEPKTDSKPARKVRVFTDEDRKAIADRLRKGKEAKAAQSTSAKNAAKKAVKADVDKVLANEEKAKPPKKAKAEAPRAKAGTPAAPLLAKMLRVG
jgi:hypothetical protein